ncbi:MAG: ricin-type beta-trefoil lectin domain protein [Beijerinckiaceae bacterium]|nr:ricin-type beta-trefoil lectin domain protein [Beijerinckiaceae bacterium]
MSSSFRILTLSGFLLITALGSSGAHGATLQNQTFINNGARCLGVTSDVNSTPAFATSCFGSFNQKWNWEGIEIEGIGTSVGEGGVHRKCLDVRGGGTADGTIVQIFDCNGTDAQKWHYNLSGQIVFIRAGKCLDLKKINRFGFDEFQAVIRTCRVPSSGNIFQQWRIH